MNDFVHYVLATIFLLTFLGMASFAIGRISIQAWRFVKWGSHKCQRHMHEVRKINREIKEARRAFREEADQLDLKDSWPL